MKMPLFLAAAGLFACSIIGSAAAAQTKPWPFNVKTPPNPALGLMNSIDDVKVSVSASDPKLITITVQATAPGPGYSNLTLVGKPGPLNDLTFAFEARGRPPQQTSPQPEPTQVTLGGTYEDAPIAKVKTVEIYARNNCMAYSVADGKTGPCTVRMPKAEENDLL
jgi:hypothetical protein